MVQRKGKGTRGEDNERIEHLREKALIVIERLKPVYPDAKLELEFDNAFQLLISAILAAQESDKKVNSLRPKLFSKYKTPEDIAKVPLEELEEDIKSVNYYRRKAKLIKSCCTVLVEKFKGEIPRTVEEMIELPGVGRKTANMVIGGAFGLPAIIVDRHVLRVSKRLGFTEQNNADKVEMELREIVPKDKWTEFSFLLLNHGKAVCKARNPDCSSCPLCDVCDYCKLNIKT